LRPYSKRSPKAGEQVRPGQKAHKAQPGQQARKARQAQQAQPVQPGQQAKTLAGTHTHGARAIGTSSYKQTKKILRFGPT